MDSEKELVTQSDQVLQQPCPAIQAEVDGYIEKLEWEGLVQAIVANLFRMRIG